MLKFNDEKQQERLKELYRKEEEDLVQILSERYDIPYIDLSIVSVNTDALRLIPEDIAIKAGMAAWSIKGKKVLVAIISPKNKDVEAIIADLKRKGYAPVLHMASKESLGRAWGIYKEVSNAKETQRGVFDISHKEIERILGEIDGIAQLKLLISKTIKETTRYKVSHVLEVILAGAISVHASDVHIEPQSESVRLRFRLDGVLQDTASFDGDLYRFLLSRIKLLSRLKLNVKESAQDGRFSIKIKGLDIEIRTSILPGEYGESIVMRVLNPDAIAVTFEELGIEQTLFDILERQLRKPNGMILTTGPTGSGKTTTLYAFLRKISSSDIKVITIEDPIEYHLKGISQTQVNTEKGYGFLEGLRSALRQDPDIMMVGEIRDGETATVAVNAALTGHLVFSTLHTNTAAGVIPRLLDLGVNSKIISSALNISLAQRLVRKLCEHCKQKITPSEKVRASIEHILLGVEKKRGAKPEIKDLWTAPEKETNDCAICGGTGYKGRIGIFEGIVTDTAIEEAIVTFNPSEREIKKAAEVQGLLDMREDGVLKVLDGITSFEELRRVVDVEG